MDPAVVEKISSTDFNADKYVRELSQRWVGGHELLQQRRAVQALSESTNIQLKKNVYENYTQFIETAKEITHLESEMYQLSHLLTEQKTLLDAIYHSNIHGDLESSNYPDKGKQAEISEEQRLKDEEEARRRKLTAILEKVEGCSGLLEVKGRTLMHEGDLVECDAAENTYIQKIHAYLFNDALMLTSWITNRRGPARYKMIKLFDINTLAVVNVRDLAAVKYAFKILASTDAKLLTCSSANAKKEWMDKFEFAKKQKLASEKMKRDTLHSQSSIDSKTRASNPFDRELSGSQTSVESPLTPKEESKLTQLQLPDWFLESPEELDVFIAERNFDDALNLINDIKTFKKDFSASTDLSFIEISKKTDNRRRMLIEALVNELKVSPDKSLQGGLRSARRAVRILNALDKQTQACELMLQLCTSIMKKELKGVKKEGSSEIYVRRLSHQFYSTVLEVASEFTRSFASSQSCIAALIVWADAQLAQFVSHVVKQVFVPQVPLNTVAECVTSLREQNDQLSDCGIDLRYQMDGILLKPVTAALHDAKEKAIEALKHRAQEDKWRPLNMSNKTSLNKLLAELKEFGITVPASYIRGECWLELTANTVTFIRTYLSLLEDCCRLHCQHLTHVIEDTLYDVVKAQLRLTDLAQHSHTQEIEVQLIHKNAAFVLDHLLPLVEEIYKEHVGLVSAKLSSLNTEYKYLRTPGGKPKPAPRQSSVTRYSQEEFI